MAYLPFKTRPVFSPRLAITRFHTGSPVCGFMASAAPSRSAGHQQPRAVDGDDIHGRVAGVVRPAARGADPDDVAGALVEGDEALRAVGHACPRSRWAC